MSGDACKRLLIGRCFYEVVGYEPYGEKFDGKLMGMIREGLIAKNAMPKYGVTKDLECYETDDLDKLQRKREKETN